MTPQFEAFLSAALLAIAFAGIPLLMGLAQ